MEAWAMIRLQGARRSLPVPPNAVHGTAGNRRVSSGFRRFHGNG